MSYLVGASLIEAGTVRATNVPSGSTDVTTKSYVDTAVAGAGTVTNVSTSTGIGGGPISISGTVYLLDTAVTPGTYGTSGTIPVITVDQQGRITGLSTTPAASASGDWTSFTPTMSNITNATGITALYGYYRNPGGVGGLVEVIISFQFGRTSATARTQIQITVPVGNIAGYSSQQARGTLTETSLGATPGSTWIADGGAANVVVASFEASTGTLTGQANATFWYVRDP